MSDLMHLAYVSTSRIDGNLSAVGAQVASILNVAQENNARLNITGALLFSGGYFCQVLEGGEGGEGHVSDLFETIQMDDRHSDVTVLHFEPLGQRGFGEWAMAYAGIEETLRFDIPGIKASKDELMVHEAGQQIVSTLSDLALQQQALARSP